MRRLDTEQCVSCRQPLGSAMRETILADGGPIYLSRNRGSPRILRTVPMPASAAARMPYLSMSPASLAAFMASIIRACKLTESASKELAPIIEASM
jgi:hypothetical protein